MTELPVLAPSPIPILTPTKSQVEVLHAIIFSAVVVSFLWSVPLVRLLITPLKLLTITFHELCHIAAALLTGGIVLKISIDPIHGGVTVVEGGHPLTILSAGYIGSALIGGLFVFAGWNTLVAKIMSPMIGIGLMLPRVLEQQKLNTPLVVFYEGLLIGLWFIDHVKGLRFYCLFIGIMNLFYVVWDVIDEIFFHKPNGSDVTQFVLLYPRIPRYAWVIFWLIFEVVVLIAFVLIGIAAFKHTSS